MYRNSKVNKTKEVFEKIVTNVQTIVNNGEYEKFLKFANNFRNYSFNNMILIFNQFPEATMVAGKSKWIKMNRELISGAQKIFILAPVPRKYSKKVTKIEDGEKNYGKSRFSKSSKMCKYTKCSIPLMLRNS